MFDKNGPKLGMLGILDTSLDKYVGKSFIIPHFVFYYSNELIKLFHSGTLVLVLNHEAIII
jgi:hypothetical protein